MFDLRTITRQTLVWLAASMVPVQPLWVISCCSPASNRQVARTQSSRCPRHAGKTIERPPAKRPGGCMCPDTTPTPEEPMARFARRKSEAEQQDDSCWTLVLGTVRPGVSLLHAQVHGPARPVSASEHCALLCRLLL